MYHSLTTSIKQTKPDSTYLQIIVTKYSSYYRQKQDYAVNSKKRIFIIFHFSLVVKSRSNPFMEPEPVLSKGSKNLHCNRVAVFSFFLAFDFLSVLRGHSVFFIPFTTANDLRLRRSLYPRFYPLHLFSHLNS